MEAAVELQQKLERTENHLEDARDLTVMNGDSDRM
jgi:hypothetical protein